MILPTPLTTVLLAPLLLFAPTGSAEPRVSSKRGLVSTPDSRFPQDRDAHIWTQNSPLTWYYNYQAEPSPAFDHLPQSEFEFVPMLWGKPENKDDTTFLQTVERLVGERKINITHVLGFNEPDGPRKWGGSDIDPDTAAHVWLKNIAPLRERGIRVGLPACTGSPDGTKWLDNFLKSCSKQLSGKGPTRNCTFDFVNLHWYGNFEGLASHIGGYSATYAHPSSASPPCRLLTSSLPRFPDKPIWITEYNLDHQDLSATQAFYNSSADYFDKTNVVERYSLFGAFRSDVSNVGPNAAMLDKDGRLTDIGAWYLGRSSTGVIPSAGLRGVEPQHAASLLGAAVAGFAILCF